MVFDSGVFVLSEVFLGSLTSLDFLASLDFKLRNTSLQRSWGCDACGVGAGGVRFLPPPSLPPSAAHLLLKSFSMYLLNWLKVVSQ